MAKALIFNVGAEPYVEDVDPSLTNLQELVGGYIEAVYGPGWHAYVNEEGKWMGLEVNGPATGFAERHGWVRYGDYLVGTVVFFGADGMSDADVPDHLVKDALNGN